MLSDAKPETNNKAAKLEKSSYRESKDMKEIRSIFGGHHTGSVSNTYLYFFYPNGVPLDFICLNSLN